MAIETLVPICSRGLMFLSEVSNRLAAISGDSKESSFLFQRLSMLIQRFNLRSEAHILMKITPTVNHSRLDFNLMC